MLKNNMNRINTLEKGLSARFEELEEISLFNQEKVLKAFLKNDIQLRHFSASSGYGYDDIGRDTFNRLVADIFQAESAIASPLITCGSHALTIALFGLLRPNDILMSVTGAPYDTLQDVIHLEGAGSLKDFGIKYEEIPLINDKVDILSVIKAVKEKHPKVVYLQRSRGYAWRAPLSIADISKVVSAVRKVDEDCFVFVDNCYGEFVEMKEPTQVGVDVCVGSFIKNIGGGIAPTGGYFAGTKRAIDLIASRFTSPSLGGEVGSYAFGYRLFYQGIFLAPHTVCQALKGAYLIGEVMSDLGFDVYPTKNNCAYDIIKSIKFKTKEQLIEFVRLIQSVSPVDSSAIPYPWDMPGYAHQVIMASGSFVQGSSIELSCDSPIKEPYIAYFQGGLTYEHVKITAEHLLEKFKP